MPDIVFCIRETLESPERCFRIPLLVEVPKFPSDPNPPDPIRELQALATIDALSGHLSGDVARVISQAVADGVSQAGRGLAPGVTVSRAALT